MPIVKLTPSFVRAVCCSPEVGKADFFDAILKGFMLEVRASGGKKNGSSRSVRLIS
jgi:hypothetical protein